MLYREATCKVCGKPITAYKRTVLCGSPECDTKENRANQRLYRWRQAHGDVPYPYDLYREIERTCPICGKPVRSPSVYAVYCVGWCRKVADSNRMARFYLRHRERILAKVKARKAAERELVAV